MDVGETIQESPCLPSLPSLLSEDKITPTGSSSHIYQDIDNLGKDGGKKLHLQLTSTFSVLSNMKQTAWVCSTEREKEK